MPSYRIRDSKTGAVTGVHILGEGVQRTLDQLKAQATAHGRSDVEVELVVDEDLAQLQKGADKTGPVGGGGGATVGSAAKSNRRDPDIRFETR